MQHDPSLPATLAELPGAIGRLLSRGAADPRSAFHWPCLVTVKTAGAPSVRTIVLRAHDAKTRRLTFYTDSRAQKVEELRRDPRAAIHVYDPKKRLQLRLDGEATLETSGHAWERALAKVTTSKASDFSSAPAPGSEISAHDAFEPQGAAVRDHLALIHFTYQLADYLHLGRDAHLRARVDFSEEPPRTAWLVP